METLEYKNLNMTVWDIGGQVCHKMNICELSVFYCLSLNCPGQDSILMAILLQQLERRDFRGGFERPGEARDR